MKTYGIIMAGGGGERFWPLSRKETPKQLLNLSGKDVMVNEAIVRLARVCPLENIFIVTNECQVEKMRALTEKLLSADHILSEPAARNTAACIGYAAMRIKKTYGDGILVVTPSDAYIRDDDRFAQVLKTAVEASETSDSIVTIGIQPTFPATGYGYIRFEKSENAVKKALQFVEKPDFERAKEYLFSGEYVWNSGMFIFKASVILQKFKELLPEIYSLLAEIGEAVGTVAEETKIKELYPRIRSVSVDYGIMERTNNILVVPAEFGWSDVGSWDMLSAIHTPDDNGNIVVGEHFGIDTKNCVIFTKEKPIATVGLSDLIVVDTEDVVLVCEKERAQEVKKIVELLRARGKEELL